MMVSSDRDGRVQASTDAPGTDSLTGYLTILTARQLLVIKTLSMDIHEWRRFNDCTGNGGSNDYWRGDSEDGGGAGNNGSVHVDGPIVKSDLDGHITIQNRHGPWNFYYHTIQVELITDNSFIIIDTCNEYDIFFLYTE